MSDLFNRKSVQQALKAWHQAAQLGQSSLASLQIVEHRRVAAGYDGSPASHGRALRDVLREAFDLLRPSHDGDLHDKRWRAYNILTERYINGRSPDAIADQLGLARSTYDHAQNAAIEALADILREMEQQAQPEKHSPYLAPPRPSHSLIGRDEVLDGIKQALLSGQAHHAIYGLPGMGKTALVLHLASEPEVLTHFRDGILWAGLGRDPNIAGLLGAWMLACALTPEEIGKLPRIDERASVLRALIGTRRMLLVIDDAWRSEDAAAFRVGGPNCAYMLTTRQPALAMNFAGASAIHLQQLDASDACTLLEQFAPSLLQSEPELANYLIEAVGSLPLALTLIGQYLRTAHAGSPRRLRSALERLQSAEARLELVQQMPPVDQQPSLGYGIPLSLLRVIALSIEALPESTQQALYALSIFPPKPNSFTEEAALSISAQPADGLDSLIDAGLLSITEARYSLHTTIADYGRYQLSLAPSSESQTMDRFAAYYLPTSPPLDAEYITLDTELTNLLTALDVASHSPLIITAANSLCPYLESRGLYHEAEHYLSRALAMLQSASDPEAHFSTLSNLGRIHQRRGDLALAEQTYGAALNLAYQLESDDSVCETLQGLGVVSVNRGDYTIAEAHFLQSLALARQLEQPERITALLINLGTLMLHRGDSAAAETYLQEGLAIARAASLDVRISALLTNLGVLYARRGEVAAAEQHFRESLALTEALGNRENTVFLLTNLGTFAAERGRTLDAETAFTAALTLARKIGQRARISQLLANLGMLAIARGAYDEAQALLDEGLTLAREISHPDTLILNLINVATLNMERSLLDVAASAVDEALAIAQSIGHQQYIAVSVNAQGELLLRRHDLPNASSAFDAALTIARTIGNESLAAHALFGLAKVTASQGQHDAAQNHAREAMLIFQRIDHPKQHEVSRWLEQSATS